ncbi:MAG: AraC family transcriptional regulator [Candidatus Pelethousia sp.]|nr:AraC family transcriptional regulator [Candidatus Pelethousia sp.]
MQTLNSQPVEIISLRSLEKTDAPYHAYIISERTENRPLHYHDFYQICFVAQGSIIHRYENGQMHLYMDDAFIIPPGFVHSVMFPDPNALVYSLYFKAEVFFQTSRTFSGACKFLTALKLGKGSESQRNIRLKVRLDMGRSATFRALMECLLREIQAGSVGSFSTTYDLIDAMLLIIAQSYFSQSYGKKQLHKLDENREIIRRCIAYIDQNYMQELSVTKLTHQFAISRTTFNLIFPTMAGDSFKRYLTHKRIQHAVQLVGVANLSFTQIARMVGYDDFSTFYRNFTKIVGASPSQYRKELEEGVLSS